MAKTAELRWWLENGAPTTLAQWFADNAPGEVERSDRYLRLPGTGALGVKRRGGTGALELKLRGSQEPVEGLPDGAAGVAEIWQKWSLPMRPWGRLLPHLGLPARSWRDVAKRRRTVTFIWSADAGARLVEGQPKCGCRVELALVTAGGAATGTSLGFEAFGPDDSLRSALLATTEVVLGIAGPVDGLTAERSAGYPEWLDRLA